MIFFKLYYEVNKLSFGKVIPNLFETTSLRNKWLHPPPDLKNQ